MIIGIDVREGVKTIRAGKGEYVYQVVGGLIKATQHQFVLLTDQPLPSAWQQDNVIVKKGPTNSLIWQLWAWLYIEFTRSLDVYFSPTSLIVPALLRSVPVVTALMDFVSFLFPSTHNLKSVWLERMWMRPALINSRRLIAISESTKQDAIKLFKINPQKIIVTLLAASFVDEDEPYPLPPGPIILFVGTLEPRKNLAILVKAFEGLKPELPAAKLVMVGRWGWQREELQQTIGQSPYRRDIHILTDVKPAQKRSIYKQAQVFVFPSLYEGFGLPPLEAMSLGVPVVASKVASLPEVVGAAGILVNPYAENELYEAMKGILTDRNLAEKYAQAGRHRATQFTWDKTVQHTLAILEEIGK
ncbi:TPA: hypothetical protein DCR79_02020 [Patescibacteria group bacterium]|uniref:Glycosyl transferase group 1 n=1 Tax=candidate division Kazan bacterium GW2011_GWB1_45_10 TaxID=1620411 RepID=A0A0G1KUM6_UNCK3|nr:MAG: Glycosyl transferase group 1 [candidate division Kazan bacterium GW2011_GWB1_45_10]HAR55043.1 hypothetical protein [Patescibacteria group bacterium]